MFTVRITGKGRGIHKQEERGHHMHRGRKTALGALVSAAALLVALLVTPVAAGQQPATGVSVPITGSATNDLGQLVEFNGTLDIDRIAARGGQLVAIGGVDGTLTNTVTGATQTVSENVVVPLQVTGTCDILHLELGPLDLDLLGLVVHLDQVVLDITAEQGPGNLLGNLLCAVAGLLDNGGPLQGISQLLNRILAILGGL